MLKRLRSALWMQQDEISPPILGPGGFIMAGRCRLVFAVADRMNAVRTYAHARQRFARGFRTFFAERAIVFFRAPFVAISFNKHVRRRISIQSRSDLLKICFVAIANYRAVKGKMNRLGGKSGPI